MRPWFTVGALAVAARRANVVGAVRATLMPDGLEIELMRVSGFAQGFAPGGVAEPVSFRVPYTAVRGLVREGRLLYLSFDPTVVAPYNRFALSRFVDDPGEALASAYLARARARWASLILPAPLGALVAALVPTEMVSGPLGRTSVGLLAALLFFVILREIFAWSTWGGPRSSTLSERFEAELAERLALLPPPIERAPARMFARPVPARTRALAIPPPLPPVREPVAIPRPAASGAPDPATRLAWPIAAAACTALGIVGVMAFLERYAAPRPAPPAVEKLMTGLGAAARGMRLDVREPPQPERCLCMRAESLLWAEGISTLAVLTFRTDEDLPAPPTPELDRAGFPQMSFQLAVVNDGARPLRDVQITLTFWRRNADGKRVGVVDRGVFWEGVLAPGHAVKWHVSAPGSEMRVDVPVHGTLEKSRIDPAPANAFFGLTQSKFRAVRLHGAMMLAYLRDPRAAEAARSLSAQTAADEEVIGRVRRAAAPVIACDVHRENDRLEACLWNGASQPRGGLTLREVGPGEPRSVPVTPVIPVHEGLRVTVDVPDGFADDLAVVDPQGPQ